MRRRDVLKAATLLAAPLAGPALGAPATPAVAIYDSRHAASRLWAESRTVATVRLDARNDVLRIWRELERSGTQPNVAGVTTWADFQVICGCATEAGLRVRHDLVRQGEVTLVSWTAA